MGYTRRGGLHNRGLHPLEVVLTHGGGKLRLDTPMLFCCGFLLQFLVAGLTGIMLAVSPFDWQLHDSYFVIAHFHFTLIGGLVFGLMAGMYYWYPKVSGRMYNERLGKLGFWLFVIGFNTTFMLPPSPPSPERAALLWAAVQRQPPRASRPVPSARRSWP